MNIRFLPRKHLKFTLQYEKLMAFRKIVAVCSENQIEFINT